jgi:single-strand DNA-binding protein
MINVRSLNEVRLIGRLGKNAEARQTKGGKPFATFSVATESLTKNAQGANATETTWHSVLMGGERTSKLVPMLVKGCLVLVSGYIRYRKSEDGQKTYTDIVANDVQILTKGGEQAQAAAPAQAQAAPAAAPAHAVAQPAQAAFEDDGIPF